MLFVEHEQNMVKQLEAELHEAKTREKHRTTLAEEWTTADDPDTQHTTPAHTAAPSPPVVAPMPITVDDDILP